MTRQFFMLLFVSNLCLPGSFQESKEPNDQHKVNFCGVLRTAAAPTKALSIENIGLPSYKGIRFYEKPANPDIDPGKSFYEANLKDILKIERTSNPVDPEMLKKLTEKQKEKITAEFPEYRGRRYVDLMVTFNDPQKSQRPYIIEATRRMHYYEILDGKLLKKHIDMQAVQSLEIKGHYERPEDKKAGDVEDGKRCKSIIAGESEPEKTPLKK
jgi:hypothetical protein